MLNRSINQPVDKLLRVHALEACTTRNRWAYSETCCMFHARREAHVRDAVWRTSLNTEECALLSHDAPHCSYKPSVILTPSLAYTLLWPSLDRPSLHLCRVRPHRFSELLSFGFLPTTAPPSNERRSNTPHPFVVALFNLSLVFF